jgi:cob(I)alamin adenosyltransferase
MKIYTKTGDAGYTSLAKGDRVLKSDPRVDLYGTSDELNSSLGMVISFLSKDSSLKKDLELIQNLLFELGSELAGFLGFKEKSAILEDDIVFLEERIDAMESELTTLKNFILPGGTPAASFLHLSRTICRRLERSMVNSFQKDEVVKEISIKFINRLSDFLFVGARYENHLNKINDTQWTSRAKKPK